MTGLFSTTTVKPSAEGTSRAKDNETQDTQGWWQRRRRQMLAQYGEESQRERSVSPPTSSDSISDEEVPIYSHESKGLAVDGDHAQLATQIDRSKSLSVVESLPAELLIKYLPSNHDLLSTMLVSKTWCIATFPLIWQRPPLGNITQFAKFVRALNDPGALLPYATTVRRLVCSEFARDLTDELFSKISSCHNIDRLIIPGAELSEKSLITVIRHLPDLISADLAGIDGVTDEVARQIARDCHQVQGLNFTKCKRVSDEGILELASSLKMLRRMKLTGCHRLTDRAIFALVRNCPLLTELDIMSIPFLTNDSTIAVFLNAGCLRDLKIRETKFTEKLDENAIPNLWELSRMDDQQLFESVGSYPWYMTGLTGSQIEAMKRRSSRPPAIAPTLLRPVRSSLNALRVVDFTSCRGLQDISVENLVSNAPQLRSLTLTKCDLLTDASLDSISRLGKYLHYLHLGHVDKITDAGVLQLANSCVRLRFIDVANCSQLTDRSVVALATSLTKLRRIGLVKITNITDDGIRPLVDRFLTLERIHLSYCDKITVKAIAYLLNRLPLITHLSLSGVPAFRTSRLQKFCRHPPTGLNDGQRADFCVYSGPGVAALRNHLNTEHAGQYMSDASSGRRSSRSSSSSVTIPGSVAAPNLSGDETEGSANRPRPPHIAVNGVFDFGGPRGLAAGSSTSSASQAASQSPPIRRNAVLLDTTFWDNMPAVMDASLRSDGPPSTSQATVRPSRNVLPLSSLPENSNAQHQQPQPSASSNSDVLVQALARVTIQDRSRLSYVPRASSDAQPPLRNLRSPDDTDDEDDLGSS